MLAYSYDLDHCVADVAVTDAGGNYTLTNMETGRFVVRFETRRASRAYLDQWSGEVDVIEGQNTTGVDAVLQAGTDNRMRAAVIMGTGAGSYSSAVKVGNFLESKGLEVEWLLSGRLRGIGAGRRGIPRDGRRPERLQDRLLYRARHLLRQPARLPGGRLLRLRELTSATPNSRGSTSRRTRWRCSPMPASPRAITAIPTRWRPLMSRRRIMSPCTPTTSWAGSAAATSTPAAGASTTPAATWASPSTTPTTTG